MVPSVQPKGEKHVVATYVVQRKYEPQMAQCNDFVILRRPWVNDAEEGVQAGPGDAVGTKSEVQRWIRRAIGPAAGYRAGWRRWRLGSNAVSDGRLLQSCVSPADSSLHGSRAQAMP